MGTEQLVDGFGRVHRDLRVAITDRCNFRCTYCMSDEGMQWLPRTEVLTFEEIERVASVCVQRFGFDAIRVTGGEPTVRAHLPVLIRRLAALGVDLSMTTNGATLAESAADLRAAGLQRVNISCDSLRRDRFKELTRRDELPRVLAGIDAAVEAGLEPVKVNVVVMRGVNDDEVVDFARFGRDRGVTVRFIEFMPLDADERWNRDVVVARDEIVAAIDAALPVEPVGRLHEPAERYRFRDGSGEVGVIPSVTDAFCGSCDRVRLTPEGGLRNCLFALEETDLRAVMRSGGNDDDLAAAIGASVAAKWAGHAIGQVHFIRPAKSMSQIGGERLPATALRPAAETYTRAMSETGLTHLDPLGRARMVDVTPKDASHRRAVARARVHMEPETTSLVARGAITKGDVLAVARVAGIQAAKRTSDLIPLCHPLLVGSVLVNFRIDDTFIEIEAQVDTVDRTGVEMEALTACSVAALTIYDMCKSADRSMVIGDLTLWEKTGGRSGPYRREAEPGQELGVGLD